jgi:hypothetical protein
LYYLKQALAPDAEQLRQDESQASHVFEELLAKKPFGHVVTQVFKYK